MSEFTIGTAKVTIVEKLGDRAKFNSPTNIEVRKAEVPQTTTEEALGYLQKIVNWAHLYYKTVEETKAKGAPVNPRQIKKNAFSAIFGAVEAAKPASYTKTVKAEPIKEPLTKASLAPKLDPKKLAERFDTYTADDLPDSGTAQKELPPLLDDEDDLLGQAHVVGGEDVLRAAGVELPNLDNLGDAEGFFD